MYSFICNQKSFNNEAQIETQFKPTINSKFKKSNNHGFHGGHG